MSLHVTEYKFDCRMTLEGVRGYVECRLFSLLTSNVTINGCCSVVGATENAGVENAIRAKCKGGKFRSSLAVWKA